MVSTRTSHLQNSAAALYELARLVEVLGLTPSELGEYLQQNCVGSMGEQEQRDLLQLCGSSECAANFAAGLRRQADRLRDEAVD